jgi:hypothetical protein
MKKITLLFGLLLMLVPIFTVLGESERWEHILTTDYFIYSFDKLSLKTAITGESGGGTLDVWLKYRFREPAIAELLVWAKHRNMPNEDLLYTKNLDYMLIHALLSKSSGRLELETVAYDKKGIPMELDPSSADWQAIVPGSVNEYLFQKIWEFAAGHDSGIKLEFDKQL